MSSGRATEITGALPMADARYVKAKTCVWWDIENCQVPRSCDPYSIAQNISKSLADMNYKGVVTISAYGDTTKINSSVQQALSSTGIALNHVPAGIKDASDKKILVDMLIWGYDNPPPANHLLISGDRDFSNALHQLSMRRYNILLAQPEKASQALVSASKTVWLWTSLVVGGRPLEKPPNFHNTSTNSKSNTVTESNSVVHPSQPDDFNLKNNNNGNFYNGNKARKSSKTQSQPVISASLSKGNDDVCKQSIGSSDSSNPNQENDLKHPNSMFVSTTAELGSNCIRSNSNSNIMTESNRILYSSQPDDINQKNNDNEEFDNHKKEEQISRTQSQPVISTSSSNGNGEGNKQYIGSSDSPNSDQKHPNSMFVSTTAELSSNCIRSNSNSTIMTESNRILYSSQPDDINQKNNDNGEFDNHKKEEQISRTQSQPVISTSSSSGNEQSNKHSIGSSDSPNSDQSNELKHPILSTQPEKVSQALVSAAKTVWQWTSLVVGGRPVEKIPNLHDTLANSISNKEMQGSSISNSSQPDDLNQKSSNNGNFDNHGKAKQISKSQSQPIMISSSSNGNEEDSKLSIGSSDSSKLNQMDDLKTPDLGSNCIPKSQQLVDSCKSNALSGPMSNCSPKIKQKKVKKIPSNTIMSTTNGSGAQESSTMNEMAQPSHAHEAKEGGNISDTSSSFSMTSFSQGLPESDSSNSPNNDANSTFTNNGANSEGKIVIKKNRRKNHKQQNLCSQPCSSPVPAIKPNDYQSVPPSMPNVSSSTPIPDISASSSNVNEEGNTESSGSPGSSNFNQKNDLKLPSHTFVLTVSDLESNCISSNTNPTPCIPKSQQLVDSGKFNASSRPTSNCKSKIKQKVGNISNNTPSSYSTKSSSSVSPESNPSNASKINATVKFSVKKNRKKIHKQQQNQRSQSCFQSRNLYGSNYNHDSSSSTVPTIRPNNYHDVLSAMPNVPSSTPVHIQMGFILEALNILKSEGISPTEINISDCIRYGNISVQNFDVKMSLDYAVEHQVVVMHKLGNFMPLYVGRNDTLWNCVNIMDSNADHGTEIFDAVHNFLSSANGRSAILSSQCRYQAALILKELCLKNMVLGEILQLLHIIIQLRKWIIPHASGWQPLAITVFVNSEEVSTSSPSTAFGWGADLWL